MPRRPTSALAPLLLAAVAPAALSQQATPAVGPLPAARDAALEEITVTARKREESIQDIPLVVNALDADEIERSSIQGLADVALRTPGLNYEGYVSAGQAGAAVIRGLSQTQLTNRVPNVAVFYDGVYLQNQAMLDIGVADLERVEVLKGPQSALYGRNAFAGAINYITRKPSFDWTGSATVTAGRYDRKDLSGFLSGPILPGFAAFKLSWAHSEFDGSWTNHHPGAGAGVSPGNRGNIGGFDNDSWSLGLTLKPIDEVEVNLGYTRVDIDREPAANYTLSGFNTLAGGSTPFARDLNCLPRTNGVVTANALWCGKMPLPDQLLRVAGDPRLPGIVVDPRQLGLQAQESVTTASIVYDVAEGVQAYYLYGRADYSGYGGGPNDRDPVRGTNTLAFSPCAPPATICNQVDSRPNGSLRTTSHELRLQSTGEGRLTWLAGLYYSEVGDFQQALSLRIPLLGTDPIATLLKNGQQGKVRFEDRVRAYYGSLQFAFTPQWSAAVEARYNDEDKEIFRITNNNNPPGPFTGGDVYQAASYGTTTWRASLDWKAADDVLAYLSAAKGEKAGGFNLAKNPALQGAYDPETNVTWELGLKSELLDRRLRLNGAIYFVDWKSLQAAVPQIGPNILLTDPTVIGNLGSAESKGLELELGYVFTGNFSATLALAFNDPKYKDACYFAAYNPALAARPACQQPGATVVPPGSIRCDDVACRADASIRGNSIERQSKRSGTLLLTYADTLSGGWNWYGNLDFNYQSAQYTDPLNAGNTGARGLVNARLGLGNDQWELAVWSKNLLDEEYVASTFFLAFSNSYVVAVGDRRTLGVTARYRF